MILAKGGAGIPFNEHIEWAPQRSRRRYPRVGCRHNQMEPTALLRRKLGRGDACRKRSYSYGDTAVKVTMRGDLALLALHNDLQSEWAAGARRSLKFCKMQLHLSASSLNL
jgi:hypothetical protein